VIGGDDVMNTKNRDLKVIKRICVIIVLGALLIALVPPFAAYAAKDAQRSPRYTDEVGLLTASQVSELTAKLDSISEKHQFDVVITVTNSTGSKSSRLYAADFYEEHGFGFGEDLDGIILMLAMDYRDYAFVTTGYGLYAFSTTGQEYMEKLFLPQLKKDEFFEAFMNFADAADDFLTKAKAGERYEKGNIPLTAPERRNARIWTAVISLVIAIAVPAIVVGVWTSQLKSVRKQDFAGAYIRGGSMRLNLQRDIFLHRSVSRTARSQNSGGGSSGSFKSSSGRSFSGRSGRF